MKKFLTTLLLSAVCLSAFAQKIEDPFKDTKWDLGFQMNFFYNHSFKAPEGLSPSGFGFEVMPIEMQWKGWKGGSLSVGILDMYFDWQYLNKGYNFTGYAGEILPVISGKGQRFDLTLGFPLGFNHQFSKDFGISLSAVPGIGFYSVGTEAWMVTNLKAVIWYSDFGVVLRYQPIASKDMGTTMLSVGIAFRN